MEEYITFLFTSMIQADSTLLYSILFASSVVENLFPPIPGDTVTLLGAFLVGTGRLSFWPVYIITTAGSTLGFMMLVLTGRKLGRVFFINKNFSFFSSQSIINAEEWFSRFGYGVVFANRFLPGIRSVISIVTGISMLRLTPVLILSALSAALWNLLWVSAGSVLGDNWETVRNNAAVLVRNYNITAVIIISLAALFFIGRNLYRKRKTERE
jgi:membrane protein DedA with SNARE-associated domain